MATRSQRIAVSLAVLLTAAGVAAGYLERDARAAEREAQLDVVPDPLEMKFAFKPDEEEHRGYFGPFVPFPRRPGTKRIAVLGDSVTHGSGVPRNYSQLMQTALGPTVEVLNFAFFGYDIQCIAAQYTALVAQWRPDVVVYGYYVNDQVPTRLVTIGDGRPVWVDHQFRPFVMLFPPLDTLLHLQSAAFRRWEGAEGARWVAENDLGQKSEWPFFERWFEALRGAVAGTPLIVLAIPPHTLVHQDLSDCDRASGQPGFCESNLSTLEQATVRMSQGGVPVVSGLQAYRDGPVADLHQHASDPHHPNAEGHRRLALALTRAVEPLLQR